MVPPLDRRVVEAALFSIQLPMIGEALVAAGATTAAAVVLGAAVMVALVGGVRSGAPVPRCVGLVPICRSPASALFCDGRSAGAGPPLAGSMR